MTYTVMAGDTLDSIAQKYEISKEQLMQLNQIYAQEELKPGTVLVIREEKLWTDGYDELPYCGEKNGPGQEGGSSCAMRQEMQMPQGRSVTPVGDNLLDYTKPTPPPPGLDPDFNQGSGGNRPNQPGYPNFPNRPPQGVRPPVGTIIIRPDGSYWPNYNNQIIIGRPNYNEPNMNDVNYNWQEGRDLRYLLFTDKYRYREGERIRISFRKRNITNQSLVLRYPSGQLFDFYISDERGMELWRWSDENSSTNIEREIILAPNQSENMTVVWDQRTKNGYRVPAQRLTIWGVNHASEIAIPLEIQIY